MASWATVYTVTRRRSLACSAFLALLALWSSVAPAVTGGGGADGENTDGADATAARL